ncbi:NUDIX hydrolase [Roseibium sp. M-1]
MKRNGVIMPWKLLSSKVLIADQWFRLRADRCERPDGLIIDPFYIQEASDCVCVLALTHDGKIVVTNEYRHGAASVIPGLPGGIVDQEDAGPQAAAERELLEETGYRGLQVEYLGYTFANAARQTNRVHHFLVRDAEKVAEQCLDGVEDISVTLHSIETVTSPGFLRQSSNIACLYLAHSQLLQIQHKIDPAISAMPA